MPLSRLENFLKNSEGNILYVNPSDFDSTDSIENQGNSLTRPFKTIQRALLEAARFSYQQGRNNDKIDKTTILVYPGIHYIDNRPGFAISKDPLDPNSATFKRRTGKYDWTTDTSLTEFGQYTNFDILDTYNDLYKFNSINGGVILPRGASIVGLDLRKTKIRPLYVPDPENDSVDACGIFNLTGTCYINSFTIFDADLTKTAFKNYSFSRYIPKFSHHKLSAFTYADGVNNVSIGSQQTDLTDLGMYYFKVAKAFATIGDYPATIDFEPSIDEYRIVGSTLQNSLGISSIVSSSSGIVTVTTANLQTRIEEPHNLYADSPVLISGVTVDDASYNGSFLVKDVIGISTFTYLTPNPPVNFTLSDSNYNSAQVSVENDTVTSASPYIFNCTLRSVYGMNGLIADGNKTDGFRSAVVAQFTAISLQKDDNAFILYDKTSGQFKSASEVDVSQRPLYRNSNAIHKPSYENSHIKVANNAFVQAVSVFAIGFSKQFITESGGDFSITNSNSNFGSVALESLGFKDTAYLSDNTGYITHIIPPKEIFSNETEISWLSLDTQKIVSVGDTSKLYLYGYNSLDVVPPYQIDSYKIGTKRNELLNLRINVGVAQTTYTTPILMPVSNGTSVSSKKEYKVDRVGLTNNISSDIINLTTNHQLFDGEKVRVFSDTGKGPDGIELNKIYYVIKTGLSASQIKLANSYSDATSSPTNPINNITQTGGVLTIVSSVTDKVPGDAGHPIQYDSNNKNWYVVGSASSITNQIYNSIIGIGTLTIGNQTAPAFITRKFDNRSIDDRIYLFRYVIPKEFTNARAPQPGFILQESSSTRPEELSFNTNSLTNSLQLRNNKIIVNAYTDSANNNTQKVTIETELPHNFYVGDKVEVSNIFSSNNPTGIGLTSKYNGVYQIISVPSSRTFTYNIVGVGTNPGTITNSINERDTLQEVLALPYVSRQEYTDSYYIYRTNTIQNHVPGDNGRDGIYHLIVLASNVSPEDSVGYGLSQKNFNQDIRNLYPQIDRDNYISDPSETVSSANLNSIGNVITDDKRKSITKEALNSFIKINKIGIGITGVSLSGIGYTTIILYTDSDHRLNSIKSLSISNAGSGYGSTTLYASPLVGLAGTDAIVRASLSSGNVVSVVVVDGGSGYSVGAGLTIAPPKGISPSTNATITVTEINDNVGDGLELSGFYQEELNGLYRIISVPSSRSIIIHKPEGVSEYNPNTTGRLPVAIHASKGIGITSFSFADTKTGIVTVTTSLAHGLLQGNKFKIVGSGHTIYDNSFIVKDIVGINTFTFNIGIVTSTKVSTTGILLKGGISANGGDSTFDESEIGSRFSYIYAGISTTISSSLSVSDSTLTLTGASGFKKGDYILLNSEIIRLSTYASGNQFSIIRGQFGTSRTAAVSKSLIKKIKVLPVEVRRPSFMRASGHTFEYVGFGPGNYSTAFPSRQTRSLSDDSILYSQARKQSGGTVVYTGMNDLGEFYSGTKKVSSTTGEEKVVDAPIITFTGDDIQRQTSNRLSGIFDDVLIKERIVVEGGTANSQTSQFYGPVNFTKKITNISDDGILVKNLSIKGLDVDRPKLITMGIGTPTSSSDKGNISLVPEPSLSSPYIGNIYLADGSWRRFGLISQESDKLSFKVDKIGIGNTGTSGNLVFNYTNLLEVNGTAKISNLLIDTFTVSGSFVLQQPVFNNLIVNGTIEYNGIGVTYTQIHKAGISSLNNLYVSGVSTFIGPVGLTTLLTARSGKFNNIGIATANNNTIDTYSGGLILNSASGITTITDNVDIIGNAKIITNTGIVDINSGILTTRIKDAKSLQIGIGTVGSTSYNSSLELYDKNNVGFSIVRESAGISSTTTLTHIGTSDYVINAQNAADFIIKTNNTERINVSSGGTITYKQNNSGSALRGAHLRLNQSGVGDVALSWFITNNNLNRRWYAGIDTSNYSWKLASPTLDVADGQESFATINETKFAISTTGDMTLLGSAYFVNATLTGDINLNGGNLKTTSSTFNLLNETPSTINFGLNANTISIGNSSNTSKVVIRGTTVSTSSTTGSLVVNGGVGITSNLYVGAGVTILGTADSSSKDTGSLVVNGGVGISSNLYVGGAIGITNNLYVGAGVTILGTANATSKDTGSLVVNGGVGIEKNLYVGAGVTILGTTVSTSSTTGSLVVNGGVGIEKNLYVGAGVTILGSLHVNGLGQIINATAINISGIATANTFNGNFSGTAVTSSTISSGIITVTSVTDSSGISTGALVVNGGVGIGKKLYVGDDIIAFASDERLKTNIKPIENALDKTISLNGFTYNFNETAKTLGFDTKTVYVGVSAQEVQSVLPEAVKPAPVDPNYITVQYEKLVPLLIEAIKELKKEIDILKGNK